MKFTSQEEKIAALEALLFIHGEPMTQSRIAKMLGVDKSEVPELVAALHAACENPTHGIGVLIQGDEVQLVTKPAQGAFIGEFLKEEMKEDLTPAALETLSLVSYLGPVSRAKIEYVRGVNSSFTLRNLRIRGLVERTQDPANAASYLYSPSAELLRHLGALRKEELPEYEKFKTLIDEGEQSATTETTQEEHS